MAAAVPSIEKATQGVKVSAVLEFLKHSPTKLLIGGKWVPAKSGKAFETINPANEEVLALVAEGDKADVDDAVKAARKAFEEGKWRSITPHQRTRYLLKLADLIDKYADELAELESLDNGKPVSQARAIDIAGAAGTFRYFAGWPTKIYGETNPSDPSMLNYTLREPVGVCGLIIPWNFPLLMAVTKIAPALACGNTMILKPAEQTSLTALRLGELIQEAGIPDGVVNIITGFGPGAGSSIAEHPDIDKVSFTGSTEVGKLILRASTGNLKARIARTRRQVAKCHLSRRGHGAGGTQRHERSVLQFRTGVRGRHADLRAARHLRQFCRRTYQSEREPYARRSARLENQVGPGSIARAVRPGKKLPRSGQARRRENYDWRRSERRKRVLRATNCLCRCEQRYEDRAGRDLRTGRGSDSVQGRKRRRVPE
jgi:hypothetical protein